MDFRKFSTILAVFLLAVLIVQPVVSAVNVTDVFHPSNGTKIGSITPDNIEKDAATTFYNSGDVLVVQGDYANAITRFDQALAENTTMIKKTDAILFLYRDKAYAQIQLGKFNDAIATVDAGLTLYPRDAMLWNNRGYALYRLGKMQDALTDYDSSVSFDRNYTIAYINQGDVLSQMGRFSEAVAAYTRANETDPFNIAAADGLAAAKKGEASSSMNTTILLVIVLIVAAGIVVWYVKVRKPVEPAPEEKKAEEKKTKSRKK
jgi:tetratricopeptide (TPR) repeat protein